MPRPHKDLTGQTFGPILMVARVDDTVLYVCSCTACGHAYPEPLIGYEVRWSWINRQRTPKCPTPACVHAKETRGGSRNNGPQPKRERNADVLRRADNREPLISIASVHRISIQRVKQLLTIMRTKRQCESTATTTSANSSSSANPVGGESNPPGTKPSSS